MQLPFLKESKWPRVATKDEPIHIDLSGDSQLEDFCIDEMFECLDNKDALTFRRALETLVRSCFEYEESRGNE